MPPLSAERLVATYDAAEFEQQQAQVHETALKLGLSSENAVIVGSAGLVLHGLAAHIRQFPGSSPFDVDAFVSENFFDELDLTPDERRSVHMLRSDTMPDGRQIDPPVVPVQFTGFEGRYTWRDDLGLTLYSSYAAAAEDRVEVSGLPTLPADRLAAMKVTVGRSKDLAGVIKAHLIGFEHDNPAVHDAAWRDQVAWSARRVLRGDIYTPPRRRNSLPIPGANATPLWLKGLMLKRFKHPAFEDMQL